MMHLSHVQSFDHDVTYTSCSIFVYCTEDETESVEIPDDFSDFLTIGTKGHKLDERTIRFLCANGVNGIRSFLLYSQQSFQDMLSPLSTVHLPEISCSHGLWDVKIYGNYLFLHDIIDINATAINFDSLLDVKSYQLYLHSHSCRGGTGEALQEAVALEMDAHIKARQAMKARQLSLHQSLGVSPNPNTSEWMGQTPLSNPNQDGGDRGKPVITPPETPSPDKRDVPSTSTGGG